MNDYINGLTNGVTSQLLFIKKISHELALKIKTKYTGLIFLLPLLKCIYVNPFIVVLFTLFIGFFLSNLVLTVLFTLLLIDCIILSLLVLHSISLKLHARRLAKNILSLFLLYFNPLGSIITIILAFLLYTNYNKMISKLIIKLIENVILFIFVNIPTFAIIYPDGKQIKYDQQIDSTSSTTSS
jgi:hypothetical protein